MHIDALIASAAQSRPETAAAGIDAEVLTWRVLHCLKCGCCGSKAET